MSYDNDRPDSSSQIFEDVVFVLSGFQNPLRTELRLKALSMGATYSDEWNKKCTHLICAFANTPKYAQVEQSGKGRIVTKQWINDCFKQKKFLAEEKYKLKTVVDDIDDDELMNFKEKKKKTPVKRRSTTNRSENKKLKIDFDEIPDFFHGIHFYVSYGDYNDNTLLDITRVILAYDGILERQINENVKYVITNRLWNHDFEKISKSNRDIKFVNLDWLQDCHDANQFVSVESYLTVR